MKKIVFTLGAALALTSITAQNTSMEIEKEKAIEIVETSLEQEETMTEVYGLMVARLNAEASQSEFDGNNEIAFEDLLAIIEQNVEVTTYSNNGQSIDVVSEPSMALLDDGLNAAPPERVDGETQLAYVQRIGALTESTSEHHDYIVIATTGGEQGLVYARASASANSIAEASSAFNIGAFPNPVTDIITLTGIPAGTFPGKVVDSQGKTVMEISVTDGKQIDMGGLSAGFYTLSVLLDGELVTEKIQVKK